MVGLAAQEVADTDLRYLSFLSLGLAVKVLFEPLKMAVNCRFLNLKMQLA